MEVEERRTGAGGSLEEVEAEVEEEVDDVVLVDAAVGGFEEADGLAPLPAPAAARMPVLLRCRHRREEEETPPVTWGPERAGRGLHDDEDEDED